MSHRDVPFHVCKSLVYGLFPAASLRRRQAGVQRSVRPSRAMRFETQAVGVKALPAIVLLVFFTLMAGALVAQNSTGATGLSASVNPFIGTSRGAGGGNNLFPGATVPFGMVQLSPDTESNGYGYHYYQSTIQGFSMTHMSGPGCSNEGEVFFTGTTGPVWTQLSGFESPYSHDQESAAPGYYQVKLSRWGINVELAATNRTGMARFSFPAGKEANILVPISHTLNYTSAAHVRIVGDRQIEGYVEDHTFCNRKFAYKVYFVMTFDRPFAKFGTWNGIQTADSGKLAEGNRIQAQTDHGQWIGAYVTWPAASQPQTVTAKIAISYVDQAGAENNMKTEEAGKTFSQVRSDANNEWNNALGVIDVTGGTPDRRTVFYSGLYHSLLMPTVFDDADGRYNGFDQKIHQIAPGHSFYVNFSDWDTYRSEMPLLALIEPKRTQDMAQSIVLAYKQGGWIPRWPELNYYQNSMLGSPETILLSTIWLDGLHGFDIDNAWKGMLLDATQAPPPGKPYVGEEGIDWINKIHYVPNDKISHGSVSQIQEDAIAYASLYRVGLKLGKTDDAKMLSQRALYYRNVFNPADRFFRPRNADGQWVAEFDPSNGTGFVEGTGWHYQWLAPTDMAWLIQAVGPDLFNKRLTNFFKYPNPKPKEEYREYYTPYNETDLEAPFEFNFSGKPWESQRVVRRILKENYTNTPDGIPGNDDCGEMSSWAVMSMMGIYSVDPAGLAYELVSPVFSKVVIHLKAPYSGKAFTIETTPNPQATPYIQSVKLNGNDQQHNWITYQDMTNGGTLHVALGSNPNHAWGSAPQDAPPSLSQEQP
ncbi:MAG: GH92 family glycosyl hydrolase [Acidobacteriaceae bacterium]